MAYGTTGYAQRLAAIEAVAAEIAPVLGWQPGYAATQAARSG